MAPSGRPSQARPAGGGKAGFDRGAPRAHIPRMSAPRLFDTALRRARLDRARKLGQSDEFLMPRVAEEMAERLLPVLRDFPNAVDLMSRGTDIADALKAVPRIGTLKRAGDEAGADIAIDGEALPFKPG